MTYVTIDYRAVLQTIHDKMGHARFIDAVERASPDDTRVRAVCRAARARGPLGIRGRTRVIGGEGGRVLSTAERLQIGATMRGQLDPLTYQQRLTLAAVPATPAPLSTELRRACRQLLPYHRGAARQFLERWASAEGLQLQSFSRAERGQFCTIAAPYIAEHGAEQGGLWHAA